MKEFWNAIRLAVILCGMLLFASFLKNCGQPKLFLIIEYPSINTATVNGKWTTNDEWTTHQPHRWEGDDLNIRYNIQDFTNLGLE